MGGHNFGESKFDLGAGNTIARIRKGSSIFEIIVNLEDAMKVKKGESDYLVVEGDAVFTNVRKGDRASSSELETAFGTSDINEIGKIIVKQGEVLVDQAHRTEEQERKFKQIVDYLVNNAVDPQTRNPISPERMKSALQEAHVNIKNTPIETQIPSIVEALSRVIPIKIETRKVKITIPAMHTGKVYGLVSQYKEKENWLDNGSLEIVVNIPAGGIIDFYDKLNSMTQGSALTEEITE